MAKKTFTKENKTGCCPRFDPKEWDESEVNWKNKKFIKDSVFSIMHMPLGVGKVMKKMWEKVTNAKAEVPMDEWLLLAHDPSPWRGEFYMAVSKKVPGVQNITLSGKFLTKVFEGPFKEVKNWFVQMNQYVESKGKKTKKMYFFYTSCPKCAKVYGKNYVVAFAQV